MLDTNALATTSNANTRNMWRQHLRNLKAGSAQASLVVGVASSFTSEPLAAHLGSQLLQADFSPVIENAPFNQIFQVCENPSRYFKQSPDILILLPRIDELCGSQLRTYVRGNDDALEDAVQQVGLLHEAISGLRQDFKSSILVGSFPWPRLPETRTPDLAGRARRFVKSVRLSHEHGIFRIPNISLAEVDAVEESIGLDHSFDERKWYCFRQPYTEGFFSELGAYIARLIRSTRQAPKKCIVVDADNTLWGGIVGEDGLSGIQLGDEFPGSVYADFQRLLQYWRHQGIFLAVASKNEPAAVKEVFRKHRGMILKETDISAWAVGWQPKSESLSQIARSLNIGIDSLVFVDDSDYELAEVAAQHPDVMCIKIPANPEGILRAVHDLHPFDRLQVNDDDRMRVDRFAIEVERDVLRSSLPVQEFIESIDLKVNSFVVGADSMARVHQLINKTNQFNITMLRMPIEQLQELMSQESAVVLAAEVEDRFGGYGLTCVAIASRRCHDTWTLDGFLMSCRVLGRGVETSFLADVAAAIQARGGTKLIGEFVPTDRNQVASGFLAEHGFEPTPEGTFIASVDQLAANRPAAGNGPLSSGLASQRSDAA